MDNLDLSTLTGCKILEDLNGEVHEILVSISAPLEKGMEYWIINLEEREKMSPDSRIDEYVYSFIPLETSTIVGHGVKIKIEEQIIYAPKGSPFIENPEQIRFERSLIRDKFFNKEKFNENRELSVDEKIELWINKKIPNSPNKVEYLKAFKIICEHPSPKSCTYQSFIEAIYKKYPNLSIGDEMLRKRIPDFVNSLPL